jgi:hypothetical protein
MHLPYHFRFLTALFSGIGATDIDGTLIFTLNNQSISIDIRKPDWESVKPLYHSLIRLQTAQRNNCMTAKIQTEFLAKMMIQQDPMKIIDMSFAMAAEMMTKYYPVDYKSVWDAHKEFLISL